jgi:hypothetical protein
MCAEETFAPVLVNSAKQLICDEGRIQIVYAYIVVLTYRVTCILRQQSVTVSAFNKNIKNIIKKVYKCNYNVSLFCQVAFIKHKLVRRQQKIKTYAMW